jgi:hypothetical protein
VVSLFVGDSGVAVVFLRDIEELLLNFKWSLTYNKARMPTFLLYFNRSWA